MLLPPDNRACRGFSILEFIFAIGIIGITTGVIYAVMMQMQSAAARNREYTSAVITLRSLVDHSLTVPWTSGTSSGGVLSDPADANLVVADGEDLLANEKWTQFNLEEKSDGDDGYSIVYLNRHDNRGNEYRRSIEGRIYRKVQPMPIATGSGSLIVGTQAVRVVFRLTWPFRVDDPNYGDPNHVDFPQKGVRFQDLGTTRSKD